MRKLAVVCLVGAVLWGIGASAQTFDRGAIRGVVYDKTHAIVAKAQVTLSNPSTGFRREEESDNDGGYNFAQVPPGVYTLLAEAPNFQSIVIKNVEVSIGASLNLDITLPVKSSTETVDVTAEAGAVDTTTSGVNQVVNQKNVENLPLLTQDYRDLAQLSANAQVVPGLRGGIRLGGQQSDYSNLVIDGTSNYDNFFGEFFGSLETKNFTIPIDSVQEFQVVSNGFAPEFGRATGGLINVVTKSGTNEVHGTFHYYYRGDNFTKDDALGNPSNIERRNEVGGTVGFPIHKDRQFLFFAGDLQRQHGPLLTQFCAPGPGQAACEETLAGVTGPAIGPVVDDLSGKPNVLPAECTTGVGTSALSSCYGVNTLGDFLGVHSQFVDLYTVLGKYDYQFSQNHHFSTRIYGTQNHTSGFTGGRGQNEIQAAFGNTEIFYNNGVNGVAALNSVFGAHKTNEVRFLFSVETRPRHPNGGGPEVSFGDPSVGSGLGVIFGQRFFLPINGDDLKTQIIDNFEYTFGKHDIKFGGDVDIFDLRKNVFAGWSKGTYFFADLDGFINNEPVGFIEGFGLNGKTIQEAAAAKPAFQTGTSLYVQDKWQVTPKLTLTYGIRWDGSKNPQPETPTPGTSVLVGANGGSREAAVPQNIPNDYSQWGPRVGAAYQLGSINHLTVLRAAWGLYYAQTPTIFFPTTGGGLTSTMFCCAIPASGFPYLYPTDQNPAPGGIPSITYVDPDFKNPRVSNFTAGIEHSLTRDLNVSFNFVYAHSARLRTGGFSSAQWSRNFTKIGEDEFGRSILSNAVLDGSIGGNNALGSFSRGNYQQYAFNVTKKYSQHFQVFANYTYSRNRDNATSERDTDTFFGPQDPYNLSIDYGRNGLDITHQFKAAGVYDLPWGFSASSIFIAHSGVPFPAYINGPLVDPHDPFSRNLGDLNGDGVNNQGGGFNDRPTVNVGGKSFLLDRYPANQPDYFNWDFRIIKDFGFKERYHVQLIADFFNLTNRKNLYSNPSVNGTIQMTGCSLTGVGRESVCDPLTAIPKAGVGGYRTIDQVAPGSSPFTFQAGAKFNF